MIDFHFLGNPPAEEKEMAKKLFIESLGSLKDEFENNGGVVTFDYSIPKTSSNHCQYIYDLDIIDFTRRWNEQIREQE